MGCFSFLCKESGKAVASDSFSGDACRIYLLQNGKVIEEMHGHYNSYGQVFDGKGGSFEWKLGWDNVCNLIFSKNSGDGIAIILECYYNGVVPTTQSYTDPKQGWGKNKGKGVIIDEPLHITYYKQNKIRWDIKK
jgi:hypothetical protein